MVKPSVLSPAPQTTAELSPRARANPACRQRRAQHRARCPASHRQTDGAGRPAALAHQVERHHQHHRKAGELQRHTGRVGPCKAGHPPEPGRPPRHRRTGPAGGCGRQGRYRICRACRGHHIRCRQPGRRPGPQQQRQAQQRQQYHRQPKPEQPGPAQPVHGPTSGQRCKQPGQRKQAAVARQHPGALAIVIQRECQRGRARQRECHPQAHQHPCCQQQTVAGGQCTCRDRARRQQQPHREHPQVPYAVAQRAQPQHQRAVSQHIADRSPADLPQVQPEVIGNRGKADGQREVQRRDRGAQHHHQQGGARQLRVWRMGRWHERGIFALRSWSVRGCFS